MTMNPTSFLVPLTDQGLIRASGADAASFLHNLLTNDIEHISAGSARHAGLCTAKGRLIASFLIWREGEDFLLQLSADILPAILKKLSMYVLRSKVKLTDLTNERVLIGVCGPQAAAIVGCDIAPMSTTNIEGGTVVRLDEQRFILSIQSDVSANTLAKLSTEAKVSDLAAWHLGEIAAGIPRIVAATQEAFVPQMVNYEVAAVGGVSFQKGCYPGQEIVARTQYLGKIKRRMYRAQIDADFPAGTDVFTSESGDQHCGAIVLTAPSPAGGYESLLVVQSSGAEAGEVHVGSPTGPRLKMLPLPYAIE
jgi:folate-binding protein YgfZ